MTPRQKKLKDMHGTPKQFEKAIWEACNDLFITTKEAVDAIAKYKHEWDEAER